MKKRLKEERIKHNLTQNQISKILNITQSHYASFENGRNVIPITRLIELSKLYKISIDYLMGKNN
ncbi:MAG: helix-turn-helix transcriptional regulator [Firmicutes bacterium]|nr:helix-turn-helix transcriptional regulator [Bacillota bacterium]